MKVKSLSPVRLFVTPWTAAHQAPLPTGFSRQEYWSGVPLPSPFLNIYLSKSGPITSWKIDGETVETVSDFIFLGSNITADGDCSHEIKRRLLLGIAPLGPPAPVQPPLLGHGVARLGCSKKIRHTKGTFHAKMGSIKVRNGIDLREVVDIKKRWRQYTEELNKKDLHDPDNHDGVITHLEPDILKCKVKWALESSGVQVALEQS